MDLGLTGKVALIAGSSRGIGFATARAFLREGANVAITARGAETLGRAKDALVSEVSPERVVALQGDMTSPADIRRALDETIGAFGGLDAVVANVGSGTGRSGWELTPDDWMSADADQFPRRDGAGRRRPAVADCARAGIAHVCHVITGIEATGAPLPYSAAKAALVSASKHLARLAGVRRVRVKGRSLPATFCSRAGRWERKLEEQRDAVERYIRADVPLQRFGTPEEIADAVVFLASARAEFITGACLVVDARADSSPSRGSGVIHDGSSRCVCALSVSPHAARSGGRQACAADGSATVRRLRIGLSVAVAGRSGTGALLRGTVS